MEVSCIGEKDWKQLSEAAHIAVFERRKPKELERIDFALVADAEENDPIAYVTCKELDAKTVYWQYGGMFKDYRGKGEAILAIKALMEWCHDKYDYIGCRVENTNLPMLKTAMNAGFLIVGIRMFNQGVFLEHLSTKEKNNGH